MQAFVFFMSFFMYALAHGADWRWNGTLSSETHAYFTSLPDPTRTLDPILWFKPEVDIRFNPRSRFVLRPTLRSNPASENSTEQLFFNPAEMYWNIRLGSWRVDLGSNVQNWGVLDGYSPLDMINGRVMYNPLQSDRRGAPMVDLSYTGEAAKLQALYIPKQARTLLPSTDSRWLPRTLLVNASTPNETVLLPPSFHYYDLDHIELNNALKHNYGLRASATYNAIDMSLVYFNGMSNNTQVAPTFQADVISIDPSVLQARSDIGLAPVYFRVETYGANMVWALEDVIVKVETAYARTLEKSPQVPDWSWQSGVGMEIPWPVFSFSATTVVQFYYGDNKYPAENLVGASSRLFDKAFLIGERVEWSADLSSLLSYIHDYENNGFYLMTSTSYAINDTWKLSGQIDLLHGKDDSLFGTYKKNDRFILTLSYLW